MLMVPAYNYYPAQPGEEFGVTVYQDDTAWWKFYLMPDGPSIRKDSNGNPVFLLIKYAFSDQDREENPDLSRGGGYLSFDVELTVPDAQQTRIMDDLQTHVNRQWQDLKDLAESAGKNVKGATIRSWYHHDGQKRESKLGVRDVKLGLSPDRPQAPPGDSPPKVIIDRPTWIDGTFQVSAPQSEALVSHRVTEGPVSLVGSNNVAANMDLTEAGATFMERTLVNRDGTGGTDMTPIQVLLTLLFWARIPPVRLRIEADTRSLHMALKSIEHDYDGHSCQEDDMYHYEQQLEMAVESSLIKVSFDTGTLSLDDDFVQELRRTAMNIVQDQIKDAFYEKRQQPPTPDDDTSDFVDSGKDIRYLKTEISYESVSINYDETIQSIVEWKANPQATLQTFFAGMTQEEISKYVRVVDLDDDFFKTLGLTVTAFADWENEPIAFIECQVQYEGIDENRQRVEKVETFTLTKENNTGTWDPSLIGNKREYSYRWRVGFQGREPGDFTRWERDTTPQLNLSIADPGKIAVRVLAGQIDFAQTVDRVQVEMTYEDRRDDVNEEATTLVLTDGNLQENFERYIFTEWDRPVRYKPTFFLRTGAVIEGEWTDTLQKQLLINAPLYDKLDVRLVPAGSWGQVVQTVVSLRYNDDENDYHMDEAYSIKKVDEFKTWSVVLQNPNFRRFEYKVLTTFQDGAINESEWIQADGDQAIPIVVQEEAALEVKLLPNLIDFNTTPVVEATLRYNDPEGGVSNVETFTFTDPTPVEWNMAITNDAHQAYQYELTYHLAQGSSHSEPSSTTDATALVLPKFLVPEVTCTLVAKLIDFVQTPVVEAHIQVDDPDHDIRESETAILTAKEDQVIRIPVHEDTPRQYTLTMTYYLADGSVVTRDPVIMDRKRIVVPKYVAPASVVVGDN